MNVEIRDKHYLVFLCQNNVTFEKTNNENFGQFSWNLRIRIRFRSICCLPRNEWSICLLPYPDLDQLRIACPDPVHSFFALYGCGSLGNCVSGAGPLASFFIWIWFICELRIRTRFIRLLPYQDPIPSFVAVSGSSPSFIAGSGSVSFDYCRVSPRSVHICLKSISVFGSFLLV